MMKSPAVLLHCALILVNLVNSQRSVNGDQPVTVESVVEKGCPSSASSEPLAIWQVAFACAVAEDRNELLECGLFSSQSSKLASGSIAYAGRHGGPKSCKMLLEHFSLIPFDARFDVLQGAVLNNLDVIPLLAKISTDEVQRLTLLALHTKDAKGSRELIKYAQQRTEREKDDAAATSPSGMQVLIAAKSGSYTESETLLEKYAQNADQGELLVPVREVVLCHVRAGDTEKARMIASRWITDDVDLYLVHCGVVKSVLAEGDSHLARRYCTPADSSLSGAVELIEEWDAIHGISEINEVSDESRNIYLRARRLETAKGNSPQAVRRTILALLGTNTNKRSDTEELLNAAAILLRLAYQHDMRSDIEEVYDLLIARWEGGFSSEYFSSSAGHAESNMFVLTDVAHICASHQDFQKAEQCCKIITDRISEESPLFLASVRAIALCGCERSLNHLRSKLGEFERTYCSFCSGFASGVRERYGWHTGQHLDDEPLRFERSVGLRFAKSGQPIPLPVELAAIR